MAQIERFYKSGQPRYVVTLDSGNVYVVPSEESARHFVESMDQTAGDVTALKLDD